MNAVNLHTSLGINNSDKCTINEMLRHVGVIEISSYDFLEKAINAEAASALFIVHSENDDIDDEEYKRISSIPSDVLEDAEKMVRFFDGEDARYEIWQQVSN
jgi:hypothetical protein